VSATSMSLISTYFLYAYHKQIKSKIERAFKRMSKGPSGKYYRIASIHGEKEERRPPPRIPRGYMGYIETPNGIRLRTPFVEIDVEEVPETVDSENIISLPEYPVHVYTTAIEASSPRFRRELSKAFSRIRRLKKLIERG